MAKYQVTLIPGDGIGPEVAAATRRVLDAAGIGFDWDVQQAGSDALDETGALLPETTLDSIRNNGIGLKGPITTPVGSGFRSVNVGLRQALELYANLRPGRTIPRVQSTFSDIDLVIVRENMEDTYAGVEFDTGANDGADVIARINKYSKRRISFDAAISIKIITPDGARRIVRFAYEYARANGRQKVT